MVIKISNWINIRRALYPYSVIDITEWKYDSMWKPLFFFYSQCINKSEPYWCVIDRIFNDIG